MESVVGQCKFLNEVVGSREVGTRGTSFVEADLSRANHRREFTTPPSRCYFRNQSATDTRWCGTCASNPPCLSLKLRDANNVPVTKWCDNRPVRAPFIIVHNYYHLLFYYYYTNVKQTCALSLQSTHFVHHHTKRFFLISPENIKGEFRHKFSILFWNSCAIFSSTRDKEKSAFKTRAILYHI